MTRPAGWCCIDGWCVRCKLSSPPPPASPRPTVRGPPHSTATSAAQPPSPPHQPRIDRQSTADAGTGASAENPSLHRLTRCGGGGARGSTTRCTAPLRHCSAAHAPSPPRARRPGRQRRQALLRSSGAEARQTRRRLGRRCAAAARASRPEHSHSAAGVAVAVAVRATGPVTAAAASAASAAATATATAAAVPRLARGAFLPPFFRTRGTSSTLHAARPQAEALAARVLRARGRVGRTPWGWAGARVLREARGSPTTGLLSGRPVSGATAGGAKRLAGRGGCGAVSAGRPLAAVSFAAGPSPR